MRYKEITIHNLFLLERIIKNIINNDIRFPINIVLSVMEFYERVMKLINNTFSYYERKGIEISEIINDKDFIEKTIYIHIPQFTEQDIELMCKVCEFNKEDVTIVNFYFLK